MADPSRPAAGAPPAAPAPRGPDTPLRRLFAGRPVYMNALMLFCFYMALVYVPWDLFVKPVADDAEVWFGILFHGWAAKVAAVPHWAVYAAGAWGFWKMKRWMWPWAAVYTAQIAIGMLVWSLLQLEGLRAALSGIVPLAAFGYLTWLLWRDRERFRGAAA